MKLLFLLILPVLFFVSADAQNDTLIIPSAGEKPVNTGEKDAKIIIYPVPVRNNTFTIKSDKEIAAIKITNIIGQEIYRIKYTNPISVTRISLENPGRGMYLVAVSYRDNTRIVKKILINEAN
jgi:hypothetical protein